MSLIVEILQAIWKLSLEMAPWLLLGFFVAGILKLFLSTEKIARHLSGKGAGPVWKAAVLGVPLPICSCGVIPVAAHLRKSGASKGATLSFLGSTPVTGVDSILATWALLGPIFALFRPLVALFTGVLAGLFAGDDLEFSKNEALETKDQPLPAGFFPKVKRIFSYAFVELIGDVGKWIVAGVVLGGLLTVLLPISFVEEYLSSPWTSYPLMLLMGIPLYVCATGSIPIAAALVLKGLSPGAALVFLAAGPATNTATLSFVAGSLGKRSLIAYLSAIVLSSVAGGLLLDFAWAWFGWKGLMDSVHLHNDYGMLNYLSLGILITSLLWAYRPARKKGAEKVDEVFVVPGMTCEGCAKNIRRAIGSVTGVQGMNIDVENKRVEVSGEVSREILRKALKSAGYAPEY